MWRIFGWLQGTELTQNGFASATHATATVTIKAKPDYRWAITNIFWSFSADPAAAATCAVTSTNMVNPVSFSITKGGPGGKSFGIQLAQKNQDVVITLGDGGAANLGTLYVEAVAQLS